MISTASGSDEVTSGHELKPITFYAFPKKAAEPSGSGFCQKLETYFRFSGIPYTNVETLPMSAPKGKLPYIKDAEGKVLADSQFIIKHLVNEGFADLDARAGLTELEKADGYVWRGFWEDHVYPAAMYTRWLVPENFVIFANHEFASMYWPIRKIVSTVTWRGVRSALAGHGIGRHSLEEVHSLLESALRSLEVKLKAAQTSGGIWFFGKKGPSEVDAAIYGLLITTATTPSTPYVMNAVAESAVLSQYLLTITEKYYPEYGEVTACLKKNLNQLGQQ